MMKSSTLRCSFGSMERSALNEPSDPSPRGTRQAICAGRSPTSKSVIRTPPLLPASRRDQVVDTPLPSGVTMPMPVTTTRRIELTRGLNSGGALLQEADGVADRQDRLGCIVGDLDAEFLFEGHHELNRIEAVRAQIVDEARILGHLVLFDAEMLDHDLPDARLDAVVAHYIFLVFGPVADPEQ